ncbi:hypothetical protein [Companilactobacillus mishanensis]|uniref:Uncharacterized protein n=1 Tax=Companilactobacillus mishanensis TaxID=2486008 RepID=A0A5P0ZKF3_9LACO|nr:hypothetical protein [Companilactobacillus mishanensis]MQS53465.1 hypothetical protein [Companilactobacillus mishanensis]
MTTNISRKDLYEDIWSVGLTKTANRLNTTSTKLKKIALDNNIPLPSPTYWGNLYAGKRSERTKMSSLDGNITIAIPEKSSKRNSTFVNRKINAPKSEDVFLLYENLFSDIELTEPEKVINALMKIKVPTMMPKKVNPLIKKLVLELKEEKRDRFNKYSLIEHAGRGSYSDTLRFHRRDEIRITNDALIIVNELLNSFILCGGNIELNNESDIGLAIDGADIIVKCHVPSRKVILKTTDKRWSEYKDTMYEPIDEKVRFSIITERQSYSNPVQIRYQKNESDADYLRRIFIKVIQLIPKSRFQKEEMRLAEIEREEEEKQRKIVQEKHADEYAKVQALIDDTRYFEVASRIRDYVESEGSNNPEEAKKQLDLADWIENLGENDVLNESDRKKLVDYFFKHQSDDRMNYTSRYF